MQLWIRTQLPGERTEHVQYDQLHEVQSQKEWKTLLDAVGKDIITSVLNPDGLRFRLNGRHLYTRSHKHETHYVYDALVNLSYRDAAQKLAEQIEPILASSQRCLIYLPLRGALPIWRAIQCHFKENHQAPRVEEYHAVTSSFVKYPLEYEMKGKHGKDASGRYANILELKRLRDWCLKPMGFDHLIYLDEIISGGMMRGHVNEMIDLGVTKLLPVTVVAMADSFGTRSKANGYLKRLAETGDLNAFIWEGCHTLITEDQKFLLGMHYTNHNNGPNIVPVFTPELEWFPEKLAFETDVGIRVSGFGYREKQEDKGE